MMRELKLRRTGAMTNASRIESIMKHMQYSNEKIQEVLATLKNNKKGDEDENAESVLLEKKHCEAQMLAELLEQKEVEESDKKVKQPRTEKPKSVAPDESEKKESATGAGASHAAAKTPEPWPAHKAADLADADPDIPAGCKIRHYTPVSASPYWRAELPPGMSHLGKYTCTKSYIHSAGVGAAKCESAAARATVVAWLWEWAEHQAESIKAESNGDKGHKGKKRLKVGS